MIILLAACKSHHKYVDFKADYSPGPHVIVYKTKADYRLNVPVVLSEDKTKIVSYPAKEDIKNIDGFTYPEKLKNGYLLDKRGITKNTAFLDITYEEYFNLSGEIDITTIKILDPDPFTEIYDCGNLTSYNNVKKQINEIIESERLESTFRSMK